MFSLRLGRTVFAIVFFCPNQKPDARRNRIWLQLTDEQIYDKYERDILF